MKRHLLFCLVLLCGIALAVPSFAGPPPGKIEPTPAQMHPWGGDETGWNVDAKRPAPQQYLDPDEGSWGVEGKRPAPQQYLDPDEGGWGSFLAGGIIDPLVTVVRILFPGF